MTHRPAPNPQPRRDMFVVLALGREAVQATASGSVGQRERYYRVTIDGRRFYAHRLAYEAAHGPIPDGLTVDHACHNADASCRGGRDCPHRACCEPTHLVLATNAENILRGLSPTAINARKAVCPNGHAYASDGTSRRCPICRYERRVASGELKGHGRPEVRTHCPQGHPYDEENTAYVRRHDGSIKQRQCRECGRQRCRDRRQRLRSAEGG